MAVGEGNNFAQFLLNYERGIYKGEIYEQKCRMHHPLSSVLKVCLLKSGCGVSFQRRALQPLEVSEPWRQCAYYRSATLQ